MFAEFAVSRLGGDRMSVGYGGPSLMLSNLPEKHSVANISAWLWLESILEMK